MLKFEVDQKKSFDDQEIQKFVSNVNAEVLVGFLSGRQHIPTLHKDDTERPNQKRRGNYVGYNGENDPQNNPPIETAELAKMLTFGSANIPARPFIEEGLLSEKKELLNEIEKQINNAKQGKANWVKLGTNAVAAIQKFVRGDYYKNTVPNSPKTVEYKGSDTPLIDGGDLINSLEFIVEGGK